MADNKSFIVTLKNHFNQLNITSKAQGISKETYISYSLDSLEQDTIWHRCVVNCTIPSETSIYISYFASNYSQLEFQGETWELDHLIGAAEVPGEQKESAIATYWQEVVTNGVEFPLHRAKGRYLWLRIHCVSYGEEQASIEDIRIDFPLAPLTSYLPEIYQQEPKSYDLLNRFLGIFQSLTDDLDEQILDVSRYLDVDLVNEEYLEWLSQWLGIDDYYMWPKEKLRSLIKNAHQLYQIKGTKRSIERVVELYTGAKPYIVEHYEAAEGFQDELTSVYTSLYGDNSYSFTVMVKEEWVPSSQHYLELKQLIDKFKPAYTLLNLVVLRPYVFLDSYAYLGINSVLSGSNSLVLDGKATIPFATSIDENGGLK